MRFHVPGIPYNISSKENPVCAFTQQVVNFCTMMIQRGHQVYHYGDEHSTVECTENIPIIRTQTYDYKKTLAQFGPDEYFNEQVVKAIQARQHEGDFLCIFWGMGHKSIADVLGGSIITVETSVGYKEAFADFRVYTSYAHLHAQVKDVNLPMPYYHVVIPCSLDLRDFEPTSDKKDYFLFIGRLNEDKGLGLAIDAAHEAGVRLIVSGPNGESRSWPSHVTYVGFSGVTERKNLMKHAKAVFMLTQYMEPFGCVAIESMACGTPVISTDWGGMSETVVHGRTGYRCRTFDQIVWSIRNIENIQSIQCVHWVRANYSFDKIGTMYEEYFLSIADVWAGKGFYETHKKRPSLTWLEKGFHPIKSHYENPTDIYTITKNGIELHFECERENIYIRRFLSHYEQWEPKTFEAFEKVKHLSGTAIDIGAWIGTTTLWLAKHFQHVVSVEPDIESIRQLKRNLELNKCHNVTVVTQPVGKEEHEVIFGPRYGPNGTAMSHIKNEISQGDTTIRTISIQKLLEPFKNVTFIKCDIEGGEEDILEVLLQLDIPIHLSFHLQWWKNQNIERFRYLFEKFTCGDVSKHIQDNPFGEVFFQPVTKIYLN